MSRVSRDRTEVESRKKTVVMTVLSHVKFSRVSCIMSIESEAASHLSSGVPIGRDWRRMHGDMQATCEGTSQLGAGICPPPTYEASLVD
jgi:hypothetical protein